MKRIVILFLAALFAASGASAQKFHNAYYDTRRAAHDEEGLQQGAIVFLGNSITEQGWWGLNRRSRSCYTISVVMRSTFSVSGVRR